jgi:hypothetical protein
MSSEILRHEAVARLRHAVATEAYDEVQSALAEYQRHVEAALAARPPDTPPPAELAGEADELMQWALQVVRSARVRARDQLDQLAAVLGYQYPAPRVYTWKMDG